MSLREIREVHMLPEVAEPRRRRGSAVVTAAAAVVTLLAASRGGPGSADTPEARPAGLTLRLGNGEAGSGSGPSGPRVAPSDEAAVARLLDGLPSLEEAPPEVGPPLRPIGMPPPRAGAILVAPFPPPAPLPTPPPAREPEPLRVLRRMPEGEAEVTSHLSVTFSQPMVPLAALDDPLREPAPVRLSPEVPGDWRWSGAHTLLFTPMGGFPPGARFDAEVPEGTRSTVGGALPQAVRWSFRTPDARVVRLLPEEGPLPRDPLFAIVVDRATDRDAVLKRIEVRAAGRPMPLRPATDAEVEAAADHEIQTLRWKETERHWLAFRCDRPLPLDSAVTVRAHLAGPAADGGRKRESRVWHFRTAGPFLVAQRPCRRRKGAGCTPSDAWHVEMSNRIDRETATTDAVRVVPNVLDLRVAAEAPGWLAINGTFAARTTYTLTLAGSLRDVEGQSVSGPRTMRVRVDDEQPSLFAPAGMVVLDPALGGALPLYTVNRTSVEFELRVVGPEDYSAYRDVRRAAAKGQPFARLPGRLVRRGSLSVEGRPNQWVERRLPLAPALKDGVGQILVTLRGLPPADTSCACESDKGRRSRPPFDRLLWVQVTRMSLEAFVDDEGVTASVSALADGRPLAGVEAQLLPDGDRVRADDQGLARLSFGDRPTPLLVARLGSDVALLPEREGRFGRGWPRGDGEDEPWWEGFYEGDDDTGVEGRDGGRVAVRELESPEPGASSSWRRHARPDRLAWHVFDPRTLYRPGEEVRLKGWLRRVAAGPHGDVESLGTTPASVSFEVTDEQQNAIASGETPVGPFGGFPVSFMLPKDVNLGSVTVRLTADLPNVSGGVHRTSVRVAEFRRPEFEITTAADPGLHLVGGRARVRATVGYFSGGPLPEAPIRWRVWSGPGRWSPEGREGYSFDREQAWGWCDALPAAVAMHEARTDRAGRHVLTVDFVGLDRPETAAVQVTPSVVDVNRQTHEGQSATLLVHPAAVAVGLLPSTRNVVLGQPVEIETLVTDLKGRAVAGRDVDVRADSMAWQDLGGTDWCRRRQPTVVATSVCRVTSGAEPQPCRFTPTSAGDVRVTASVTDPEGRPSETVIWLAVAPAVAVDDLQNDEEDWPWDREHRVRLSADRSEYRPGEVARVTLRAPFAPAEGVLTLRRSGILSTRRFLMETTSTTLAIPLADAWTPDVHVSLAVTGWSENRPSAEGVEGSGPARPRWAEGSLELTILPSARELAVSVHPREARARPGQSTTVDVDVWDLRERPLANAEVTLAVVDDSVLALARYAFADPLRSFAVRRRAGARTSRLLDDLTLPAHGPLTRMALFTQGYVDFLSEIEGVGGGVEGGVAGGALGGRAKFLDQALALRRAAAVRGDFRPLAFFATDLVTDSEGRASVTFALPDNLTRYRVLAVATDGGRLFGRGESALTADLPLMVRPSLPRFLNRGDLFELPVVVHNRTGLPARVEVAARATGIELIGGAGRTVVVPGDDRVEVRFPARATQLGEARVQVVGATASASDAVTVALPVYLPVTAETVAVTGQIDDEQPVSLRVETPSRAVAGYGGLSITTSSTAVAELEDAYLYLVKYPYECAEQTASRLLALVTLNDMLTVFGDVASPGSSDGPSRARSDLERLVGLQNDDGGFALWQRGEPSEPWVSLHAAHALARAHAKGMPVPLPALERAARYLRSTAESLVEGEDGDARRTLVAYALYVRHLLGDDDRGRARALVARAAPGELPVETLGWVLPVLARDPRSKAAAAVRRAISNRVTETSETAHFAISERVDDHVVLRSARRADAVLLEALMEDEPRSPLIPKLVRGLLAQRRSGRWATTQENAFVLLALARYFETYEAAAPDFVARAWLGGRGLSESSFRGRTSVRRKVTLPLGELGPEGTPSELVLAREGRGRLYYRVGLEYAPSGTNLGPLDRGFTVERRYEPVDLEQDVRRDVDGTWRVRAGARVRVRVTVHVPSRRYQVALVDPLPAGLEAEHSEWSSPAACWADHENRRDDRVEAFASLLWGGEYSYVYLARATTPGEFVAPPTRMEEMYSPDVFGRGATDRVVVEEPRP